MSLKPNTVLENRFQVVSLVMMGGQSIVYKGVDKTTQKFVAIKLMRGDLDGVDDADARRQFTREYEVLAGGGPGLPAALGCFDHEGRPVVVEEWVDGRTLDHEGTDLPIERAVKLTLGVLEAVEHLHARTPPVIVRDIKPSNVIVNGDRVFIIDLNSARSLRGPKDTVSLGTPGFAAPEQHAGHSEVRSDLFSVGALLSYMLCGVDGTLTDLPCSPATVRRDVSPELDDVIQRATAFDVRNRFASASDMAAALRQALHAPSGRGQRLKVGGNPVATAAAPAPVPAAPAARPPVHAGAAPAPVPAVRRSPSNWLDQLLARVLAALSFLVTGQFCANDMGHTIAIEHSGWVCAGVALAAFLIAVSLPHWTPRVPRALAQLWWSAVLGVAVLGGFGPLGHFAQPNSMGWMCGWLAAGVTLLAGWKSVPLLATLLVICLSALNGNQHTGVTRQSRPQPSGSAVAGRGALPQTLVMELPALRHALFLPITFAARSDLSVWRVDQRFWLIDAAHAQAWVVDPESRDVRRVALGGHHVDAVCTARVHDESIVIATDHDFAVWSSIGEVMSHQPLLPGTRLLALTAVGPTLHFSGLTSRGLLVDYRADGAVLTAVDLPDFHAGQWQMQACGERVVCLDGSSGRMLVVEGQQVSPRRVAAPARLLADTASTGALVLAPHHHYWMNPVGGVPRDYRDEIESPLCGERRLMGSQPLFDVTDATTVYDYDDDMWSRAWWFRPLAGRFVALAVEGRVDGRLGVLSREEAGFLWQMYGAMGTLGSPTHIAADPSHRVLGAAIGERAACVLCGDGCYLLRP